MLELRLQGDGIGELPGLDPARDRLVDTAMNRVGKVLRDQEFGDALVGLVVGEQGSQQRLLGLHVGRRQALGDPEERRLDIHDRERTRARGVAPTATAPRQSAQHWTLCSAC